jgi:hypothetical protein
MELALCICAFIFGIIALGLSIWNTILIQAQRQSTHTVIPVSPETATTKLEEHLNKIMNGAGGDQNDLNRNLSQMGLDVDELV